MLALVAVALASQAPAAAEDWWHFSVSGDSGDQQAFYADRASIRRTGDLVLIEEAREAERADEQGILGARVLVRYDCRARTSQGLRYTFVYSDGRRHVAQQAQEHPEPTPPGSIWEGGLRFACGEDEGVEQLGALGIREQALLLFAERAEHLRAHPDAPR